MRYLTFANPEQSPYPIAILSPLLNKTEMEKAYLTPFGIPSDQVIAFDLHQSQEKKKTPVAEMQGYIKEMLVSALEKVEVKYILCTDSEYFKVLTKSPKADANIGYAVDCVFGPWKVFYVPNYRQIFYDPQKIKAKISAGVNAMLDYQNGTYVAPGEGIIKHAEYLYDLTDIANALDQLIQENRPLTCDIEAFSLKFYDAGIGSITFCWNQHEGISFPVDLSDNPAYVRALLRDFFIRFNNRLTYHHISFDVTVLIYQLFMEHIIDTKGLLYGIDVMLKNWDDTKLITYLATNSCAGNKLSLKEQAQEFAGNYAIEEIRDITKIPLDKLLEYNLVDGLSTWYTYNKHWQTMVNDDQLSVYNEVFKPAIVDIIQMQLTGMPINMTRTKEVQVLLQADQDAAIVKMEGSPVIQRFLYELEEAHVAKRNATLKKKQIKIGDEPQKFNPNSNQQLQKLLFEMLALPVLSLTDNKEPSVDGDTLKSLKNHTTDPDILNFLDGLLDYVAVNKILTSFIPAMLNAQQGPDGWHYLFGNFNLGGTLSGRLSSSDPNLQNLPANGRYAKLIKSCFQAPPGWLFAGLDFASLEDRISALTTKDPNKLKVYTDGYDGHCLRAYAYFSDQMPDIDPTSVASINSIEKKYKPLRQKSKNPTFALTYQGTFKTLMTNYGFPEDFAKGIVKSYNTLYEVSIKWVEEKLNQAAKDGYVTVAFGLRVRTPLLHQVIRGNRATPYEAEAEGRSAGNALGQSWCLLNSRAGSEFMGKVRKSKFREDIRPCAQIHDAGYFLIRDDLEAILYTNEHLVEAVKWQNHPDIWHDDVKLGGELSIFYPDWNKELTLPNEATSDEIQNLVKDHLAKIVAG